MTTETSTISQRDLAAQLVAAIDAVRDAVTAPDWRAASSRLSVLVELAPSVDACRTVYVRHQLGRRADWLDRYLAAREARP